METNEPTKPETNNPVKEAIDHPDGASLEEMINGEEEPNYFPNQNEIDVAKERAEKDKRAEDEE
jgi:hypothetical protein